MATPLPRVFSSRAAVASAAVLLGLTLGACGSDDSSASANAPTDTSSTISNSDNADSSSDAKDASRPDNLADFPLPDDYTVVTSGSRGGAWTAVLKTSTDWDELRDLYKGELPRTGWTLNGERPTAAEHGIHLEASRADMEATVAISAVGGGTDIMINVVKQ